MTFGAFRALLGATALAAFALTRCGPDSGTTHESGDDTAAAGGLDGEGGDSANGGSNAGGVGTGGSGAGGSASGTAGANQGGTDAQGGQGGAAGTSGSDAGGNAAVGGTAGSSGSTMSGGAGGTPMMGGRGGVAGSAGGGRGSTGGSASGAAGAAGSSSWMPCSNPIMLPMSGGSGNSGSFGTTGAVCFRVTDNFSAWGCSNLGNRTVRVNGVAVTCAETTATWPLPARVDGAYYFEFSAGTPDSTSFYWYRV